MARSTISPPLPSEQLFRLENFGHSISTAAYIYRPTHVEQIAALFKAVRQGGFTIALRGAGRSYGDASLNAGQVVLDLSRMKRVLAWAPDKGILKVEPGFTFEDLWQYTLEDGWWRPVMPGTMKPTLGGALGANVHGKNNWKVGTLGEHILEFTALLPNGKEVTCNPKKNSELFRAMIGGIGMLGVFTSITLQLKKIHSGNLRVHAWVEPSYQDMLTAMDANKEHDYDVGWVDTTAMGRNLGRGQMHTADYLKPGEDPNPAQTLSLRNQALPANIMGLLPRSIVWRILQLGLMFNIGVWGGNTAKYWLNRFTENNKVFLQSFIAFNFLLDYVPDWERAYGRGGLIQYQTFIPKETAHDAHLEIMRYAKRRGLPAYLGVLKRHRPDNFLLSHAVDGYSLALDFKVPPRQPQRLARLTSELNQIALEADGRFYFAKDSTLTADVVRKYLGEAVVKEFRALKAKVDPDNILQSDLYRRCFES
jgi:FAD/FMN-containing dehydrogenase